MFFVVGAPTLAGSKQSPAAHIRHFGGPAPILVRKPVATPKAINDQFDLQKFCFGILRIV